MVVVVLDGRAVLGTSSEDIQLSEALWNELNCINGGLYKTILMKWSILYYVDFVNVHHLDMAEVSKC